MRSVTVAQLCQTSRLRALVIHQDAPLQDVINKFATTHALFGIFLVDDDNRLVATLNHHKLLDWAQLQSQTVMVGSFFSVGQMRQLICAERAYDLAVPEIGQTAVTLEDTLSVVLRKMIEHHLTNIPVIDHNGRVINDLLLSEILSFIMQAGHSSKTG